MDEIEQFARLRPSDIEFTEEDRSVIASAVFGQSASRNGRPQPLKASQPLPALVEAKRFSRQSVLLQAAVALVVVGLGAALLARANQSDSAQIEATNVTALYQPPFVIVDPQTWSTLDRQTSAFPLLGSDLVMVDAQSGLDGGMVVAMLNRSEIIVRFEEFFEVDIGGRKSSYRANGSLSELSVPAEGDDYSTELFLVGWQVDKPTMIDLAEGLIATDDGALELVGTVDGLVKADPFLAEAMSTVTTFHLLAGGDTPSHRAHVSLYPGGDFTHALLASESPDRTEAQLDGEQVSLYTYGNVYELVVRRGFWVWSIRGEGFDNKNQFLRFATKIETVDQRTWEANILGQLYEPANSAPAIQALSVDIPLPLEIDLIEDVKPEYPASRHGLARATMSAAVCAWFGEWEDAIERGDGEAQTAAMEELQAADQWDVFATLDDGRSGSEWLETIDHLWSAMSRYPEGVGEARMTAEFNFKCRAVGATESSTAAPSATSPSTVSPGEPVDPYSLPQVAIDLPGWTLEHSGLREPEYESYSMLFDPELGLDGPVIEVATLPVGLSNGFEDETAIDLNGVDGSYAGYGDSHWVGFLDSRGRQVSLNGRLVARDDVIAAAELAAAAPPDSNLLSQPFRGLVPADDELVAAMTRGATYAYNGPDRGVEINLYPGGAYTLHTNRLSPAEDEPITIGDQPAYLKDYDRLYGSDGDGGGRYRLIVVRDFWVWEIDGAPFADRQEFLDFVESNVMAESE